MFIIIFLVIFKILQDNILTKAGSCFQKIGIGNNTHSLVQQTTQVIIFRIVINMSDPDAAILEN